MAQRPTFDRADWLLQVTEEVIDADRPIIDPHHHLWSRPDIGDYLLADLHGDTGSGHRVEKTVFVECGASYLNEGPEHMRPVGETEFVARIAAQSDTGEGAAIAGIVAHADLRLDRGQLDEVLDAHEAAGGGRFRGIRDAGAHALDPSELMLAGREHDNVYADDGFRAGVRHLGTRGLTYDTWHYHHQMRDYLDLARAVPDTLLVLDHFGTPLGVGQFAGQREEIFQEWRQQISDLARCDNVVAKVGGMAMPDNGFGWHRMERPPTSDEFVAAQARYYHHTIESFGPDRCMFESNFPVDKLSISYLVLWNGLKRIAARYNADEQHALFWGTAERVYRL